MAELLLKIGGDLPHLHEVGEHAMDEIYLSWEDCVSAAFERYQEILEAKKSGNLQRIRRLPTDILVSMTAHTMEEQAKLRRIGSELFSDFKETAVGIFRRLRKARSASGIRSRKISTVTWRSFTGSNTKARFNPEKNENLWQGEPLPKVF